MKKLHSKLAVLLAVLTLCPVLSMAQGSVRNMKITDTIPDLSAICEEIKAGEKLVSLDLSSCTALVTVGSSSFFNCSYLSSIALPDSLISIGGYGFYGCKNLTSL